MSDEREVTDGSQLIIAGEEIARLRHQLEVAVKAIRLIDNPFEVWGYLSAVNYIQQIRLICKDALAEIEKV